VTVLPDDVADPVGIKHEPCNCDHPQGVKPFCAGCASSLGEMDEPPDWPCAAARAYLTGAGT
jgi:hypothetical protein